MIFFQVVIGILSGICYNDNNDGLSERGGAEMAGFVKNKIELDRDVQKELLDWKSNRNDTVLQVEGPRQVGKTHEVRKFAYSHYKQVVYVNLVRDEYGFEDLMLTDHFMQEYCRNAGIGEYVDDEILPEPLIPETSSFRQGLRTFVCTRCHSKNFAEH